MKELEKFVTDHDIDKTTNIVDNQFLKDFQKKSKIIFGPQLTDYILTYGYLGFEYIEFYGINSNQKTKSDLIVQTEYLHKYFPFTKGFIAFENLEEGNYIVIDSKDNVYLCDTKESKIIPKKISLEKYIINRFSEAL